MTCVLDSETSRAAAADFCSRALACAMLVAVACAPERTVEAPPAAADAGLDPDILEVAPPVTAPPAPLLHTGDLDAIIAHKSLRILVFGGGELLLPRAGASTASDRELAAAFARSLKVEAVAIDVQNYADLIPMLLAGQGDLIAARMADTKVRRQQVAFSRPTAVVDELLIGKKGDATAPKTLADLANKTVTVRKSSSYQETLDLLAAKQAAGVVIAEAPEGSDTPRLVQEVAAGRLSYTACDSDLFAHIQAFAPEAAAVLTLQQGRQIAFAMRPGSVKLKAAADAFLMQHAMTDHAKRQHTADLAEIKKRGSLRVLTRNNGVSYFLHRGTQRGFDYELIKLFALEQGLRLDVIVPADASELLPWLNEGRGDVIAAQLTTTAQRLEHIAFSQPYLTAQEMLVQPIGEPAIGSLTELAGKTIHVRKSSSYRTTLEALQVPGLRIMEAAEDQETEQLIDMVAAHEISLTVADSNIAAAHMSRGSDVQTTLVLQDRRAIAYGVRKGNPVLRAALDAFVKKHHRGLHYNMLKKQYFGQTQSRVRAYDTRAGGALSPYDEIIKERSKQYGLDWRLMAALAYQESRFDPQATSWVGALGLFQVMPTTGKEMGFTNLQDPDEGAHAGVKYLAKLIDQFDRQLPFKQRVRFALASYNAGRGHVEDARALAKERGLDPDRWFGNVEKTMLLLAKPKYARRARHGYCRGAEPVKYVSEIQSRYENYLTVVKDIGVTVQ